MEKQVVILFGAPGAGKGTQAGLLSEKLGLYYFETSRILEKEFQKAENMPSDSIERFVEVDGEKFDTLEERKLWQDGILCSPPYVAKLVIDEIRKLFEEDKSIVLSGSPRTIYEVENLMPVLEELYGKEHIKIFFINIGPEVTIFRNSHRKICELVRHSILFNDETENITMCPLDGSKLLSRELDKPETIKVRLKEYAERTMPMIDYLEKNKFKIHKVNGEQSPSDVFADILKIAEE